MRVVFGELRNEGVVLRDASGERVDSSSSPVHTLVVSRLDCDVKLIEVPPVASGDLEGLLRYRLRAIYPGDLDRVAVDHLLQRNAAGSGVVVAIMDRERLEAYRRAAPGARIVLASTLLLSSSAEAISEESIVYWADAYAEVMRFKDGALVDSVLMRREHRSADFARLLRLLGNESRPVRLIAAKNEIEGIERWRDGGLLNGTTISVSPLELLRPLRKRTGALFQERKTRRVIRPLLLRSLLGTAVVLLALGLFYKRIAYTQEEVARYRAAVTSSQQEGIGTARLQAQYANLEKELGRLSARRPVNAYRFLSELRGVLGPHVFVEDLVLQKRHFQLQAVGADALAIMERFRTDPRFRAATLLETTPLRGTGREQFVVTGSYTGE